MNRKTLFTILLSFLATGAIAQNNKLNINVGGDTSPSGERIRNKAVPSSKVISERGISKSDSIIRVAAKRFPDVSRYEHAFYQNVTKQNGLWKGIGRPLTATEASHLNRYYCLSRQVQPGKYVYLQAKNCNGQLTTDHSMGTYLANPFSSSDDGIDSDWKSKLKTVCQWEIVFDRNGTNEEDAYDADGNLIYKYFPVNIGERKIVGHFTDASGMPVNFRTDPKVKGIYIELDELGYEKCIAFVDDEQHFLRNADGAYQTHLTRDKQGNITRNMSCNMFGVPMIDSWGNCGWTANYDQRGNCIANTYIDTEGNPMRMPNFREAVDEVVTKQYTYDRYGRLISCTYLDQEMHPDTTQNGVHRWVLTYNDRGQRTSCHNYKMDSVTLVKDDGVARWVAEFDRWGNQTYFVTYDEQGHFVNEVGYGDCVHIRRYDGTTMIYREDYNTENGIDSILNWKVVKTETADTTWMFNSKKIEVVVYDNQHRQLSLAYYDFNWKPIDDGSWHKEEKTYQDYADSSVVTTVYYNADLTPVLQGEGKEYDTEVVQTDSTTRTKITTTYRNGKLVERTGYEYDETYSNTTALLNFDNVGMRARSMTGEGLFYKAVPLRNAQGEAIAWTIKNEFGEPAYALFGDWDMASRWVTNPVSGSRVLDEYNDSITSDHNPWDRVCKAFCLEVIDSTALRLGLHTGDIIMRYGDWHYSVPDSTYQRYYENMLIHESVSKASMKKKIVVMRHNPSDRTSTLISLDLPAGTPRQLGFVYHILYMTHEETQRYVNTVKRYAMSTDLNRQNTTNQGEDYYWFFVPYKLGDSDDRMGYLDGLNENSIVLAWEAFVNGQSYLVTYKDGIDMDKVAKSSNDSTAIYYTTDGLTVQRYMMKKSPGLYGRKSVTNDINTIPRVAFLADSLSLALHTYSPENIMRTPSEAIQAYRTIKACMHDSIEGKNSMLRHVLLTGDKMPKGTQSLLKYYLSTTNTIADYFAARDIVNHIDWSGYICTYDSIGNELYCLMTDSIATEVFIPTDDNTISVLTGQMIVPHKIITAKVTNDGFMRQRGLEGTFVILGCNEWRAGQSYRSLREQMQGDAEGIRHLSIAPITTDADGQQLIGKVQTLSFPAGLIGITYGLREVDGQVFLDVQKRAKKLPKAKKR